jgi:hypothetical protein
MMSSGVEPPAKRSKDLSWADVVVEALLPAKVGLMRMRAPLPLCKLPCLLWLFRTMVWRQASLH